MDFKKISFNRQQWEVYKYVINLSKLSPNVTVTQIKNAMEKDFGINITRTFILNALERFVLTKKLTVNNHIYNIREERINEAFSPYNGAFCFDDWTPFINSCNTITQRIPAEKACEIVGINIAFYNKIVDNSFKSWRDSTQSSFFHGVSYLKLGEIPKINTPVFKDLLWQTRFLTLCKTQIPSVFKFNTDIILDDNSKPIPVIGGFKAITISDRGCISVANKILKCLYLYWWLNKQTIIKLPKMIYRGIRAHDLFNHPTLEPLISVIWKTDKTHNMKRKEAIDVLIKWICERKLHQITDGNILSFTSNIPIAKYFSHGEGIILTINPSKVEILSSELHDERLQGKDYESGKQEKEYIIRIPENYDFKPENIIINDLEYFIAEQNPLSVALFNFDTIEANYELNNTNITAFYYVKYFNNTGGLVFFTKNSYSAKSRREFIKEYSFDPLPTVKNIKNIKNFSLKERKAGWV